MKIRTLFTVLFLLVSVNFLYADDHSDKLDKIVNEYNDIGMFSGNVLVAKDGNIIYEKQFGYADWEAKTPVTSETLFRIGSLNKMFTHAMIKQLENEGKLKLSDNLGKYIKLYGDERDDKITIEMLVEMKAGLGDYLDNPEYNRNIRDFTTVDKYLELIKNEPLLFEPGTGQEYSNSGYAVLGGVIEKVTGKTYADNLKERFFEPLEMTNTHYLLIGERVPNMSTGTRIIFDGSKKSSNFPEQPSPAGGMYSNARDLLKFDQYLRKTGILPPGIDAGGTPVWNSVISQLKDGHTIIVTSNFGQVADGIINRFMDAIKGKEYPKPDVTLQMKLYEVLKSGGVNELESSLKQILEANGMLYKDRHLNAFGYELMNNNKLDDAIKVFELNAKLFPNVPNVYDSLGEAYMNAGKKDLAIANYKKVLELAPNNQNAKKKLEQLQN